MNALLPRWVKSYISTPHICRVKIGIKGQHVCPPISPMDYLFILDWVNSGVPISSMSPHVAQAMVVECPKLTTYCLAWTIKHLYKGEKKKDFIGERLEQKPKIVIELAKHKLLILQNLVTSYKIFKWWVII